MKNRILTAPRASYFHLPSISAGFIAVLVGYSSSAAIIFQAATIAGANSEQISSWMWALGLGMGISSIGLSLFHKMPLLTAWSTPGAALLVTSLSGVGLSEAIGVFVVCSALILLCGVTGWFEKLMQLIPTTLAAAMLAGILLQFGLNVFTALAVDFLLVAIMLVVYVIVKPFSSRYVIPLVLLIGTAVLLFQGRISGADIALELAAPMWQAPEFTWSSIIGIAIPLFVVTMASQNVPGVVVLKANGYQPPVSSVMTTTGFFGLVLAPFGGFAFNLSAITAAICMEANNEGDNSVPSYLSVLWAGVFYSIFGLFGATVVSLFVAFPDVLIMSIAGLALLATIGNSLVGAMAVEEDREAAIITFSVTVSGIQLLGINSAFWGIIAGLLVYHCQKWVVRIKREKRSPEQ